MLSFLRFRSAAEREAERLRETAAYIVEALGNDAAWRMANFVERVPEPERERLHAILAEIRRQLGPAS